MAAAQAAEAATSCPGFEGREGSPPDIDRAHAELAVQIVQAGLAEDWPTLDRLVALGAKVEIWRGDSGDSGRGGSGVIQLFRDFRPTHFEVATPSPGPVALVLAKCDWTVTMRLRAEAPKAAVTMAFHFVDGRLADARGDELVLFEGPIR